MLTVCFLPHECFTFKNIITIYSIHDQPVSLSWINLSLIAHTLKHPASDQTVQVTHRKGLPNNCLYISFLKPTLPKQI